MVCLVTHYVSCTTSYSYILLLKLLYYIILVKFAFVPSFPTSRQHKSIYLLVISVTRVTVICSIQALYVYSCAICSEIRRNSNARFNLNVVSVFCFHFCDTLTYDSLIYCIVQWS